MDKRQPYLFSPDRQVMLDHHDSVRHHVHRQVWSEMEGLQERIASLRLIQAPHAPIMIATYERMIERKKGFLQRWDLLDRDAG